MLKIDGVVMPTPTDIQQGIMDLSDAKRNTKGDMRIQRIATKRKFELSWGYLSKEDLRKLFNAVSPIMFEVEYIDPLDDAKKTGSFYAGDRNVSVLDYIDGNIRYKDAKFNIIEI